AHVGQATHFFFLPDALDGRAAATLRFDLPSADAVACLAARGLRSAARLPGAAGGFLPFAARFSPGPAVSRTLLAFPCRLLSSPPLPGPAGGLALPLPPRTLRLPPRPEGPARRRLRRATVGPLPAPTLLPRRPESA